MSDAPVLSAGPLNSCATYEIYVAKRGGSSLVCRLSNATSITYGRVLNDFSEAKIRVNLDAVCVDCLSGVNPWQHEVLIFRSSQLVWCGPIVNIEYDPAKSSISVFARDVLAWTEKRFIEIAGDQDYDVEDVDVRQVFEWVLNHGYQKQPWNMSWSLHDTGIPITRFYPAHGSTRWGGTYKNVSSELRALAQVGVDFTVVNRVMYGGDLEVEPPLPQTLKISDNNWAVAPLIRVNGTSMSTRSIVAGGNGGFYGYDEDQMWVEENAAAIEQYGLLETFTERQDLGDEDTSVTPNAITQEAYGRQKLLQQPMATLSEGQLAGDAPFIFDQLVPGVRIQVGLVNALRPIYPDYRIQSVDVTVDADSEVVNLKLSLPGASDIKVEQIADPVIVVTPPPLITVYPPPPLIPPMTPTPPDPEPDPPTSEMTTDIPSGWQEVIAEDFPIDVAEGGFSAVYSGARRIKFYPVGYLDTRKLGRYTGAYISVEDSIMKQRLFTSGGVTNVSSIVPVAIAGNGKWGDSLSMIWEEKTRFTIGVPPASGKSGFKAAHLSWPQSNNSLAHGEIDWPEWEWENGNPKVKGYVHRVNATTYGDQTVTTPSPVIDPRDWHVYRTVWVAGSYVDFYCDGVLIGHHTNRIPYTPMHLSLQNETSLNGLPFDTAATCLVETDWIRVLVPT